MDVAERMDRVAKAAVPHRASALAAGAIAVSLAVLLPGGSAPGPGTGTKLVAEAGLPTPQPVPPAGPRRLVEEVAEVVARRYRISAEATLEFVDAAVREAMRHKLDPLLVLAVIAVESRFNPVA